MPDRAPSFCVVPGCRALAPGRRCRVHAAAHERARPNVAARRWYYTKRWAGLRAQVLRDQAYQCARCQTIAPTLDVDHIRPHRGNLDAFWDRDNLQALCKACHSWKTQAGA